MLRDQSLTKALPVTAYELTKPKREATAKRSVSLARHSLAARLTAPVLPISHSLRRSTVTVHHAFKLLVHQPSAVAEPVSVPHVRNRTCRFYGRAHRLRRQCPARGQHLVVDSGGSC
jgi:hypothetical protein